MQFVSTRGQSEAVSFAQAVAAGLAPDGGLYLPEKLPSLEGQEDRLAPLSYAQLCFAFLRPFASGLSEEALKQAVDRAYDAFEGEVKAPLVPLDERLFILELFHGPSLAFKDFALQLLGNLYAAQIHRTGIPLNVIGATSGDTGSAAIQGLLGKPGVRLFILYPRGRIAPLQERQMTCTGADNVFPIAIEGTFDDAQRIVKSLLGNLPLKQRYHLSAVNSINIARILAQSVYYLYAWYRIPSQERKRLEFVVPTGNFGNVLAGWLLKRMGIPLSFCIATNQNDILYRLFTTGHYRVTDVLPSFAPSMDIQVASNFERFLYYAENENATRVRSIMEAIGDKGEYPFPHLMTDCLRASRTEDSEIPGLIKKVYEKYGTLIDPHTSCAFKAIDPEKTSVVLATAHPAKFPEIIEKATGVQPKAPALEALRDKEPRVAMLPANEEAILEYMSARAIA